jgi:SulP family sulfate permease
MQHWVKQYRREYLSGDLVAGAVVAAMLLPQSMAYALLAGLPPGVGLCASVLPPVVYALLGTSMTLSVAPVAIDSLLVAAAMAALTVGPAAAPQAAALLALLSGGMLVVLGFLRFGVFANFLSHPVISGFTSAAAVLIAVSQLDALLGLHIAVGANSLASAVAVVRALPQANPATAVVGLSALALLVLARRALPDGLIRAGLRPARAELCGRAAGFLVVVIGIGAGYVTELGERHGVAMVGALPPLPLALSVPRWDAAQVAALAPSAAVIAFICYLESLAIARSLASRRRQNICANRELVALGAANMAAALSGGYNVAGGFSRSSVNFDAGAQTPLASVVAALLIGAAALVCAPLFAYLPKAVLAAVVLVAVLKLFDAAALRRAWRYSRADAASLVATFLAVLAFNVQAGIAAGVALSLLLYLWRTSRPHIAIVGRVGQSEHFRNVKRHSVRTCPHVLALRVDESLYFANAHALDEVVLGEIAGHPDLRHVVLVASAVNYIDASALETLETLVERLRSAGVTFHLAEVKGPVMDRLQHSDFLRRIQPGQVYLSTHEAMIALDCV